MEASVKKHRLDQSENNNIGVRQEYLTQTAGCFTNRIVGSLIPGSCGQLVEVSLDKILNPQLGICVTPDGGPLLW